MKYFTLPFVFLFYVEMVFGQSGALDTSFGINGKLTISIGDSNDVCNSIGLQSDGKIILSGVYFNDSTWNLAVLRLNNNGDTDNSFGINGGIKLPLNVTPYYPASLAIRPNDKIVVGVNSADYSYNIVQLNPDGSLDSSFGNHGMVSVVDDSGLLIGNDLTLQSDGKILVGGYQNASNSTGDDFAIERFDSNGVIDKTFGVNGRTITDAGGYFDSGNSVAVESDGAIFMGGTAVYHSVAVLKYHSNGQPDSTFGINGVTPIDSFNSADGFSIALQADHKILVSGEFYYGPSFVTRFNVDGTLDSSFGSGGYALEAENEESGTSLVIEPDDRIILGEGLSEFYGYFNYFNVSKFNAGGSPDFNFGFYGHTFTDFGFQEQYLSKIILQPDGKILAAGFASNGKNYDFAVARYLNDDIITGALDFSKPNNSFFIYPNPIHETETLQYSLTQDENLSLNLYDISGRLIQSFFSNQKKMQGDHKEELNFAPSLPPGNYVLVISNGKNKVSIKVVKQ